MSSKYVNEFSAPKVFSPIFTYADFKLLSKFSSNMDTIVSKPEKGRGVVIVGKSTYLQSMTAFLSDATKFQEITEPIRKYTLKIKDNFNRFFAKNKETAMYRR